jgi:hypothetical protein
VTFWKTSWPNGLISRFVPCGVARSSELKRSKVPQAELWPARDLLSNLVTGPIPGKSQYPCRQGMVRGRHTFYPLASGPETAKQHP